MNSENEGLEIVKEAIHSLMDIESGYFEAYVSAFRILLELKREHFPDEDSAMFYLDISSQFDRENKDEHQDFYYKNISSMSKEQLIDLSNKILELYQLMIQGAVRKKEKQKLKDQLMDFFK